MDKKDVLSYDFEGLSVEIQGMGEKGFRAKQIYEWLHKKSATDFEAMSNLSKSLRDKLEDRFRFLPIIIKTKQQSMEDGTVKYLFELYDGQLIESVFMRYDHGNSVCISTQAGCRMGCTFCASGLLGLSRNLEVSELLGQIYAIEKDTNERVSNIVLMGTGEPLDNYDNVLRFLKMITDERGRNISQRHITLSTCGLVDKIRQLAKEQLQITLAISLHASTDVVRLKTMPIARKYSIAEVLDACEDYFEKTGRRISFEYSLIKGMNDSVSEAKGLAGLLKPRRFKCHVNLIPVNTVVENVYETSEKAHVYAFRDVMNKEGIETTVRRSLGGDIDAACGQLRLRESQS